MKLQYAIVKEIDFDKCHERINKCFKGKGENKQIKDWLLKLYNHLINKEIDAFIKQWNSAPRSSKYECSYREYIDLEIGEFVNDLMYNQNLEFWLTKESSI